MKRYKLFLVIYFLLITIAIIAWLEPPLPWLLIYPGLAHRNWEVQNYYSKRSEKDKIRFKENIKNKLLVNPYVLEKNNYPYNVQAEHWVLWMSYPMTEYDINKILDKELIDKEYKYYENPVYIRSVPEIIHYHVFVRK